MFLSDPRKSFFIIIFLIIIILISISAAFKYTERFVSIHYFQKALTSSSIDSAELNINKAVALYQNDLYLRTYTQIYLLKFKSLSQKGDSLSEVEKADLKASFDQILKSGEIAINFNQNNYLNYKSLGLAYESLASLGIQNAYQAANETYKKSEELNPFNPSIKLAIARVYFAQNDLTEAKKYASQAFLLKQDYIDAMITLSQILKKEGNKKDALSFAQLALSYLPNDAQLSMYVDSLKIQETTPIVSEKND